MLLTNRKWFCDHTNHCFLGLFDEFIIDILWSYRSIVLIFHDQKIIFLLFPLSFQTIWKIIQFCKDLTNDKLLIRSDWFHLNFCNPNVNIDRIATQSVMSKSLKHCLGSHSTHSTYIPLLPLISLYRQTPLFVTWIMWNNENVNITGSYSWRNWAVRLWYRWPECLLIFVDDKLCCVLSALISGSDGAAPPYHTEMDTNVNILTTDCHAAGRSTHTICLAPDYQLSPAITRLLHLRSSSDHFRHDIGMIMINRHRELKWQNCLATKVWGRWWEEDPESVSLVRISCYVSIYIYWPSGLPINDYYNWLAPIHLFSPQS